jgi:Na+-transporting methylmalonyl-CoA/oxaloacetate decarboxylase gamma subunit
MSNLQIALTMTVIGMGIVFIGILILWGVMALMVRIWPDKSAESEASQDGTEIIKEEDPGIKAKAAAAAVAVVLSMRKGFFSKPSGSAPVTAGSSWQATTRALEINQSTQSFNRKPRGSGR